MLSVLIILDLVMSSVVLTQDVTHESEAIAELTKELRALGCPEGVEFSNKASLLTEELRTITRNLSARVETLRPYVGFLRLAQEVAVCLSLWHTVLTYGAEYAANSEPTS